MSNLTNHDSKFVEDIDGVFYQLFRAAGVAIDQDGMEQIRDIAQRFAKAIEHRAEVKSIEVIRVLQTAVTNAFVAMESDLRARQSEVDSMIATLKAQMDKLTDPTLRGNRK